MFPYDLAEIASQFQIEGKILNAEPYGTGHINETYASRFQTKQGIYRYVHQRINQHVFKDPIKVMDNVIRVTQHIRSNLLESGRNPDRECLNLIATRQGQFYFQAADEAFWRTYQLIEGARTYDVPQNINQVHAAARAYGRFQKLLATLPGERLHETIPDFHNTPKRLQNFLHALENDLCNRAKEIQVEINFILDRENDTQLVVNQMASGVIPERVAHNDTKLNNVLIDDDTGAGVCVIDLDTTMPGSILYDFGDMVRSGTAATPEDEPDLSKVSLNLKNFELIAQGYLQEARQFLTSAEWQYLPLAGKIITFEQAIRFLTDYLNGDVYYKIHHPNHNLQRARTQIKLVAEMEQQMEEFHTIIENSYQSIEEVERNN